MIVGDGEIRSGINRCKGSAATVIDEGIGTTTINEAGRMKLLVIGGTMFLGRHIVEAALAGGHEITLFNRGQHNADLFPEVEKLRGDRKEDLSALDGRRWDAVVDTCGYVPRVVRMSAAKLADAVEHYTFVSSLSVYGEMAEPGMDESAPVGTLEDETVETVTGETYGPLKALCERAAEEAMPGRTMNVRAGLIVGPHDPTDRFTYWVHRVAEGGDVLAPGRPAQRVSFVDVRDLAEWIVRSAERRTTGVYNATGPGEPCTMERLLESARRASGSDARFVWVDQEFLAREEVAPWQEMPLWLPDDPEYAGFNEVDCSRALAAGLTFRAVDDTVAATLASERGQTMTPGERAGITRERERELLEKWRAEKAGV
jgi:2'-hydroxyisoflavone reductase